MYSLYKWGRGESGGPPPEIFRKCRMQEKPYSTFLRLILYIFFSLVSFLYFFYYSLKFSGYSLYFKPSLFSNQ